MGAAKGGAVGRVGGGEGGAILKRGETYASAGGHGDGDYSFHNNCSQTEPTSSRVVASKKGLLIMRNNQLRCSIATNGFFFFFPPPNKSDFFFSLFATNNHTSN